MLRTVITILAILVAQILRAQMCAYAIAEEGGWYKAINTMGRTVADSLRPSSEINYAYNIHGDGMFPYIRNHRIGFKDAHNRLVIPPDAFYPAYAGGERGSNFGEEDPSTETRFSHGSAVVRTLTGKFGIINCRGILLADTIYDYISAAEPISGAYAARRTDTLCILDSAGRSILPPHYRTDPKLYPFPKFREGLLCAMVRISGERYPTEIDSAYMAGVDVNGRNTRNSVEAAHTYKVGFLDPTGRLVLDTVYRLSPATLGNYEDNSRPYSAGCGTGAAMRASFPRNPDPYYLADAYYIFRGGRCLVSKGARTYVINIRGDSLYALPHLAERITNSAGYFIFQKRSFRYHYPDYATSYGLLNREGVDVSVRRTKGVFTRTEFGDVKPVGSGFFLVDDGDTTLYNGERRPLLFIDSTGRQIGGKRFAIAYAWPSAYERGDVEIQYANGGADELSHARISAGGRFTPVRRERLERDKAGREIWPESAGFTVFRTAEDGPWGYLNSRGQVVIGPRFAAATAFVRSLCAE